MPPRKGLQIVRVLPITDDTVWKEITAAGDAGKIITRDGQVVAIVESRQIRPESTSPPDDPQVEPGPA